MTKLLIIITKMFDYQCGSVFTLKADLAFSHISAKISQSSLNSRPLMKSALHIVQEGDFSS